MARERKDEYRDPTNGQFAYCGDMSRLCVCGHTLGVHIAGGFECGIDAKANGEPEAVGCQCQKFRLSRRKRGVSSSTRTETKP
jgi:hypothetical protein